MGFFTNAKNNRPEAFCKTGEKTKEEALDALNDLRLTFEKSLIEESDENILIQAIQFGRLNYSEEGTFFYELRQPIEETKDTLESINPAHLTFKDLQPMLSMKDPSKMVSKLVQKVFKVKSHEIEKMNASDVLALGAIASTFFM